MTISHRQPYVERSRRPTKRETQNDALIMGFEFYHSLFQIALCRTISVPHKAFLIIVVCLPPQYVATNSEKKRVFNVFWVFWVFFGLSDMPQRVRHQILPFFKVPKSRLSVRHLQRVVHDPCFQLGVP